MSAAESPSNATATLKRYCIACHGKTASGGVNLEQLTADTSVAANFRQWQKVAEVLEQKKMPPEKLPQPADTDRRDTAAWVRTRLDEYARKNDGDPGPVTLRRLTSAEYAYSIRDLTGLDLNLERDLISDETGGEGFTNFGDVQFIQDAGTERYLEAAKRVADHAVIGSGPLGFFIDPGKTGFELSALDRITAIYKAYGFRTVSGEGGRPFGLERYGKAFYAAWRYEHRAALGEPNLTFEQLGAREGINPRFARHIWTVVNKDSLGYPSSEVAARWRKLHVPGVGTKPDEAAVRAACEEIQKFVTTWPSWLFARGDLAAGGAGDESPMVFDDKTLKAVASHRFRFFAGGRFRRQGPAGPTKVYLHLAAVNPHIASKPLVIWRNPVIATRAGGRFGQPAVTESSGGRRPPAPPQSSQPLRSILSPAFVSKLGFGTAPDGITIGPDDFVAQATTFFELPPAPDGSVYEFNVEAEIAPGSDQVLRLLLSDREDGGTARGLPAKAFLADPNGSAYRAFKSGVMELAELLPPNSHGEPNPADKDPVPEPFDNTYNSPEHDAFVVKVKYQRHDRFLTLYGLDEVSRRKLDQAWSDLFASFEYHDAYFGMLAAHYNVDLKSRGVAELDQAALSKLPEEMRTYAAPLRESWESVWKAQRDGQLGHVDDCLRFATLAWRRPLTEAEKNNLRLFYNHSREVGKLEHTAAIRALLARILVSPAFLYRVEKPSLTAGVTPASNWEMASRLSHFLWSSIPDTELRRAAQAGELTNPQQIERQVKRMLADPKARRLSTEFFGQWLGFYRFDEYRGIDTTRFPEFTDAIKLAMYDEAVSFFEHIVRQDRPLKELLSAEYTFLNQGLAKHYGIAKPVASATQVERVENAGEFHRGGMLRLGAVLTATSAPLRTSPVKRGDWMLRRVLGMPTPPPPADAGSIPADEKNFGGLSLREKLAAHQRNAACASCHSRIDPLGFPLESYDALGRWRSQYPDGKPVHNAGEMDADGLVSHIESRQDQVLRTLSQKLLGYALGRTVLLSDQPLIDRMTNAGGDVTFSQIASSIATSKQFRYRRTEVNHERIATKLP